MDRPMRNRNESFNEKGNDFYDESMFWNEIFIKLRYAREIFRFKSLGYMFSSSYNNTRLLFSSDRYFKLIKSLNHFYRKLDFPKIHFSKNGYHFKTSG